MRPSTVPPELQNLSMVEQLFIAHVHPVMRIYQVRAYSSSRQYHYSGNIINVAQDIIPPAKSLPLATAELGIVIIRRAWEWKAIPIFELEKMLSLNHSVACNS